MDDANITVDDLLRWICGELGSTDAIRVKTAVDATPALASQAEKLRSLVDDFRLMDDVEPSDAATQRVLDAFRSASPSIGNLANRVGDIVRHIAHLAMDTRQSAAVGFRRAAGAAQLRWTFPGGEIEARLAQAGPESDTWNLVGQIALDDRDATASGRLVARRGDDDADDAVVDDRGRFRLELPVGLHSLEFTTSGGTVEVRIPELHVD